MNPSPPSAESALEARRAVHVPAGAGRVHVLASGPQTALLGALETDAAYEIIEIVGVPGRGPPLHVHREFEETFYVLEGTLTVRLGTEITEVGPGGVLAIPAGMVHTWTNRTKAPIRFLQFTVPAMMETLTEAFAAAWKTATPAELAAIADRHGTTIVGPPL